MACRTEPAAVHIAHVLQRLHFFQFFNFFYNLHDLPQKQNTLPYRKNKKFIFFNNSHDLQQKKITRIYSKKNYTTRRFFCTTYIFHPASQVDPCPDAYMPRPFKWDKVGSKRVGTYGDLSGPVGSYGDLSGLIGAYGGPLASMGTFGDPLAPMGTSRGLWAPMGAYGDLWGPIGPYGDLWGPIGPKGWGASTFCTPIWTPTRPPFLQASHLYQTYHKSCCIHCKNNMPHQISDFIHNLAMALSELFTWA